MKLTSLSTVADNPGNKGPTWTKTLHDHLPLPPPFKTIGDTSNEQLRPLLHRLGVQNAHTRPRTDIVEDYWAIIRRVHDDAGTKALDAWLAERRG